MVSVARQPHEVERRDHTRVKEMIPMELHEICHKIKALEDLRDAEEKRTISLMTEALRGATITFFENEDGEYLGEFTNELNSSLAKIWKPECQDAIPSNGVISTVGFSAVKGRIFLVFGNRSMLDGVAREYGIRISAPSILKKLESERNAILEKIGDAEESIRTLKGQLYEHDSWIALFLLSP